MKKTLIALKIVATAVVACAMLTAFPYPLTAETSNAEPVRQADSQTVTANADPDNPGSLALVNEGARLLAAGKTVEAEVILSRAIVENPSSPEAYLALGNLYMTAKKDEQALSAFEQAYQLAQNEFIKRSALFNKGTVLNRLNRFLEAEMAFSECLALDPTDTAPAFSLAGMHMRQGNYEMALGWLDSVSDDYLLETSFLRCRLHILLEDADAANKAFAEAGKVLDADKKLDPESRKELARALEEIEKELANLK
ncbi:MAG: hypothetical protein KKB51_05965 [Candidatus Riflebacteria bacterium]|nr:hypothetical protein [Candidatus Riflebacteria bacterium]